MQAGLQREGEKRQRGQRGVIRGVRVFGSDSIAGEKTEQLLKPNNGLEADGPQRILLGLSQRYRLWAAAQANR